MRGSSMRTQNIARSRLYKRLEDRSRKNLLLTVFGIILIIAAVVKFGVPMIINFTVFISGPKNSEQNVTRDDITFIPPPILNPMSIATNSAKVLVSGTASPKQSIILYINNNIVNKAEVQKNGSFEFREILPEKENEIKAKASLNKKESEFSKTLYISYKNTPPSLTINSPADGESFSKDQNAVDVKGEVDAEARVTVNDFWAITDQSNHFSYTLPLKNGENQIKIIAIDLAGNKTEKDIKVTYSP